MTLVLKSTSDGLFGTAVAMGMLSTATYVLDAECLAHAPPFAAALRKAMPAQV